MSSRINIRSLFGMKKDTFKPVKSHRPGSKQALFSDHTYRTLGSGDLRGAVKKPEGEDECEWIAANSK